jgi:hypothetical protein
MPKPIVYLFRGDRTWMVSQDIADDGGVRSQFIPTLLPRDVNVETALQTVRAELPDYDVHVLNWHRPPRDSSPPA